MNDILKSIICVITILSLFIGITILFVPLFDMFVNWVIEKDPYMVAISLIIIGIIGLFTLKSDSKK